MHPKHVKSPVQRTRNHTPIFHSPEEWEENFSIVEADVLDVDTDTWKRNLGIRWDGDRTDKKDLGFPSTSGNAVWFWLPRHLENIVRANIFQLEFQKDQTIQKAKRAAERAKKADARAAAE
jgi:hypothetical protein